MSDTKPKSFYKLAVVEHAVGFEVELAVEGFVGVVIELVVGAVIALVEGAVVVASSPRRRNF